jgi:2-polyprenyl-3-methyl-5-hydroxy-6-metoxy-1,4-benzoquinol methylase
MKLFLSAHSLIIPLESDIFLIYQSLTRKGILLDKQSLNLLNNYLFEGLENSENDLLIKDISTFSLSKCLLDNPNGLVNGVFTSSELKQTTFSESIVLFEKYSILVQSDDYINKLGKRTNLFDNFHTGNFHQQIGEYVLKHETADAEMWWITQKFLPDYSGTTNTPYQWVQEVFMENFFSEELLKEKSILDFGCGIGYYSNFFHQRGGKVTGVDPSDKYLEIAKQKFSQNGEISYIKSKFESEEDFQIFDSKYDVIFLSDVFLYYFEPYKKMSLTPAGLLKQLSGLLNPKGKIYIMDPHGVFHLQSWFNPPSPYMVSVEYAHRKFRVTPNLEELSIVTEEAGLHISKIRELKYTGTDEDKKFYSEFPFWWFFELSNNN